MSTNNDTNRMIPAASTNISWWPHNPVSGYSASSGSWYIANVCQHCGGAHGAYPAQCPRVKSITYHKSGKVKRVEYYPLEPQQTITTTFPDPTDFTTITGQPIELGPIIL